jgi:hypothetical protein
VASAFPSGRARRPRPQPLMSYRSARPVERRSTEAANTCRSRASQPSRRIEGLACALDRDAVRSAVERQRGRADERTSGRADERTSGRADERTSGRADERTSGRARQRPCR